MPNSNLNAKISELEKGWQLIAGKKIHKEYKLGDFLAAVNFINEIAMEAMEEEHHPEIINDFNKVTINLWTHRMDGLTDKDFIMARKIDEIYHKTNRAASRAHHDALADIEKEFAEDEKAETGEDKNEKEKGRLP